MLSFSEFITEVVKRLEARCEDGFSIEVMEVLKNNDVKRTGICIKKDRENYSPIVYMESYYEEYKNGSSIAKIVHGMDMFFNGFNKNFITVDELCDFEQVKDKLFFRLVNYERNKASLKNIPHVKFLDLAIIFSLYLNQEGYMASTINNNLMYTWGKTVDELYDWVKINTPLLFGVKFKALTEAMIELAKMSLSGEYDAKELEKIFSVQEQIPLYMLSNKVNINGSSVILYDGVLKEIADKFENDLFIILSSIHEVLILPYDDNLGIDEIRKNIYEINRSEVVEEEILSDNVYRYSREKDGIEIIAEG